MILAANWLLLTLKAMAAVVEYYVQERYAPTQQTFFMISHLTQSFFGRAIFFLFFYLMFIFKRIQLLCNVENEASEVVVGRVVGWSRYVKWLFIAIIFHFVCTVTLQIVLLIEEISRQNQPEQEATAIDI